MQSYYNVQSFPRSSLQCIQPWALLSRGWGVIIGLWWRPAERRHWKKKNEGQKEWGYTRGCAASKYFGECDITMTLSLCCDNSHYKWNVELLVTWCVYGLWSRMYHQTLLWPAHESESQVRVILHDTRGWRHTVPLQKHFLSARMSCRKWMWLWLSNVLE